MFRTRVIAITGSYGKSTAAQLLAAILSSRFPTNSGINSNNSRFALASILFSTRPRHRFTVIEVGTRKPGSIRRASYQIDPDIALVLAVGRQHTNAFPDLEAMAREKASLLRGIGRRRVAILNGDDPHVRAMAASCKGRIVFFGTTPDCHLRATGVSSAWPERLTFTAHYNGQSVQIQTQLIGVHWLSAALGAMACALTAGLTLADCAAALAHVAPVRARLSVHHLPAGISVWRDDKNASLSSLIPALEALRQVRTGRRIVVMGDVMDGPPLRRDRLIEVGRLAARAADIALFTGPKMKAAMDSAIAAGMDASAALSFPKFQRAAEWLASELRPGDVLLIRTRREFHFERIYFSLLGSIGCNMERCPIVPECDVCEHLQFQPGLVPLGAIRPALPIQPDE
jgi:UDP-N-acetylmuramyl pentapeptide synthase